LSAINSKESGTFVKSIFSVGSTFNSVFSFFVSDFLPTFSLQDEEHKIRTKIVIGNLIFQLVANVVVYGPLRMKARTIPNTNLRENSAGIFQMSTDPAMVYTRCCA
jgi:hypothetical protein